VIIALSREKKTFVHLENVSYKKGDNIMMKEQIEAMRALAEKGKAVGEFWDQILESSFIIHGHVCGGMPLGFLAGLKALQVLGSEREANMAKIVYVETGTGHAAGCFADGVQMSTGCTFGKGLIQRTEYGKWALTLVDKGKKRAVRVSVKPEVMKQSFESPFVKMRRQGTPPTDVPLDISRPLVEGLLGRKAEELFLVSGIFEYALPVAAAPSFNLVMCKGCGEMVAENKARLKDNKIFCQPCSGYVGV
jgi:formylmethanofuran dehydrogenase subunit E